MNMKTPGFIASVAFSFSLLFTPNAFADNGGMTLSDAQTTVVTVDPGTSSFLDDYIARIIQVIARDPGAAGNVILPTPTGNTNVDCANLSRLIVAQSASGALAGDASSWYLGIVNALNQFCFTNPGQINATPPACGGATPPAKDCSKQLEALGAAKTALATAKSNLEQHEKKIARQRVDLDGVEKAKDDAYEDLETACNNPNYSKATYNRCMNPDSKFNTSDPSVKAARAEYKRLLAEYKAAKKALDDLEDAKGPLETAVKTAEADVAAKQALYDDCKK